MTAVKICGLRTPEAVDAAVEAGADQLGFVYIRRSPRHLTLEQLSSLIAHAGKANRRFGRSARSVVLMADPQTAGDGDWEDVVCSANPHAIQLHGAETPERVAELRNDAHSIEIIKAVPIAAAADVEAARAYERVADRLVLDARPPAGSDRTGGHGLPFDWSLLRGSSWTRPWMLAGGLHPGNVAEAVALTGAPGVDVSSGVESSPGVKDPALIAAFIKAARSARAR